VCSAARVGGRETALVGTDYWTRLPVPMLPVRDLTLATGIGYERRFLHMSIVKDRSGKPDLIANSPTQNECVHTYRTYRHIKQLALV
jgi:hypothetical protein